MNERYKGKIMKILVVEDDKKISEALCRILMDSEYDVEAVYDGMDGLYYATKGEYDAVVLDVMLPKMDGFEVLKLLRNQQINIPVLMLTARGELGDRVYGLDLGADDYLTKPFAPEELLARLRAITRRGHEVLSDVFRYGDIEISSQSYVMSKNLKSVNLSSKEYEVMKMLVSNAGNVISKDQFLAKVWGEESDATSNNVEAYMSFLRKKLHYIGSNINIKAVRMLGYKLEESSD